MTTTPNVVAAVAGQTENILHQDQLKKIFGLCIFFFIYCVPLSLISFCYSIVKTIFDHEKTLREQAKRMNVTSLRSNPDNNAGEIRIAKVALRNIALWAGMWTPYAAITLKVTIWPALIAKSASIWNPVVYAISHPNFRVALQRNNRGFASTSQSNHLTASLSAPARPESLLAPVFVIKPVRKLRTMNGIEIYPADIMQTESRLILMAPMHINIYPVPEILFNAMLLVERQDKDDWRNILEVMTCHFLNFDGGLVAAL
uniref:G-protein coupled receptors family 1 profile domain-containing protein n=1 Tax=Daphnia galeata TaxID=27404 RepID=A0A8J2S5V3_9CRUS|nr:unnamed protein product [Daphnia galeata]